ncbi:TOMM precursor leader peptide-binding protein [Streptomyces lycii]|uniref:TOMM leader peptide-binding protein n=1 Tax=Streptomyces lycii TaxID=2654337 RepID=A0ABQ7FHT0_9ACTN|nr:TOMM precursor leader peptide-binding protein [Streptomyces lycii]KAF4407924.1 TOMM precursor leader peptide-binding protein [Streptomyces lycii]
MRASEEAADGRPFVGFKRHLRAEVVPGEAVYLLSVRGVTALHGRHVESLAPLLDGTRTLEGLLADASSTVPAAEAGRVIGDLARAKVIGYHSSGAAGEADESAAAYWDLAGLDGARAAAAVRSATVRLVTVGRVDAEDARSACHASGLEVTGPCGPAELGPAPAGAGFSLVLCDDYLAPELAEVDAWHRAAGRPWLLARPCGAEPWTGPVFRPDDGPCWSCLAHRLRAHRQSEIPVQRALGADGPVRRPPASVAAGRAMGLHMAVLEAAKWAAGVREASQDSVCTLDTLTMRSGHHTVQRRPQCPECGDPGLVAARGQRPVTVVSRPKAAYGGGNDRALTPEQMRARYAHLVSPVTGIVTELRRDPRLPDGLNCVTSGRNLALGPRSLAEVRGGLRSLSGGKGVTAAEAEVGALCEAVERYSGTRQGDEATIRGTLNGLGEETVHPNACQLFADAQFRDRDRWNAGHSLFHQVPEPFDPDRPVDWTPVWSLTDGTRRLLPTSMLYFSYGTGRPGLPRADSNGNAAGSSPEDAIVQGFLELVERDAVAQWWYNRTRHPAVDLDSFDEPWLATVRDTCARLHRELWVLDLTADFGIPVMAAVSRRTDKEAEDISFGFGAHFDPRLALRRAVTEMNQLLVSVAGIGVSTSEYPVADPELVSWWTRATARNQPYLRPDPAEFPRTVSHFAYSSHQDLQEDVDTARKLVQAHGMELLVLDQTRPDVGLPVVKVLIPGMRHFWARFSPGRLFDVPVRLGRLGRPTPYADLNPIPLFV